MGVELLLRFGTMLVCAGAVLVCAGVAVAVGLHLRVGCCAPLRAPIRYRHLFCFSF